jgi:hypothetical protein
MKRAPEPAAFPSAERAELAAAIVKAAAAGARTAALAKAIATANSDVLQAIMAAERAEEALADAQASAGRNLVDKALGGAGPAVSVREARSAVIAAQEHLDECRTTRAALQAEPSDDRGLSAAAVRAAALAVISAETAGRGAAMAARVSAMQRELVAVGSGLEWLAAIDAFPTRNGRPADDAVRHAALRMEQTPGQWMMTATPQEKPFAVQSGRIAWTAAFERLQTDANAELPD